MVDARFGSVALTRRNFYFSPGVLGGGFRSDYLLLPGVGELVDEGGGFTGGVPGAPVNPNPPGKA